MSISFVPHNPLEIYDGALQLKRVVSELLSSLIAKVQSVIFKYRFGEIFDLFPDLNQVHAVVHLLEKEGISRLGKQLGGGSFGVVYASNGKAVKFEIGEKKLLDLEQSEGNGLNLPKKNNLQRTKGLILLKKSTGTYHLIKNKDEANKLGDLSDVYVIGSVSKKRKTKNLGDMICEDAAIGYVLHPDLVKEWAQELAIAIHAFHQTGHVHNDIKPENVFLKEKNGKTSVKLGDFGLSGRPNTEGGGTPLFAAKDSLKTPASDWYSFGKTLYAMVTGDVPNSIDFTHPHIKEDLSLRHLISGLTQIDPQNRLTGEEILAHPYFTGESLEEYNQRRCEALQPK
ncbi:MAG: protein kinase [Chlamydiia bacterium]|nr:protein kinase [Chlamydiia bacterium]